MKKFVFALVALFAFSGAYAQVEATPASETMAEIVKEAATVKKTIPAVTKMVKVKKMVAPARTEKVTIPAKYETVLGEKGVSLSGGQRQRLSLARALISNPRILILDDCTSALDAHTEKQIQATLSRALAGRTTIVVSQRVSMARYCDRVVVLEDGRITEEGTHDDLRRGNGFYARLCDYQTRRD